MKKILIGGAALNKLGSDRYTNDVDYMINDSNNNDIFIFDRDNNIDYINANGNDFFSEVWKMEEGNNNGVASPQALLELKAYSLVQHCLNHNWAKVDATEYDMKFLVRTFGIKEIKIANNHITSGQLGEVMRVIDSVR
jgi:hypothetical protein